MSPTQIITLLHERGIKATPQRVAVYGALMSLRHPCAEEVIAEVHRHHPAVSVATVYNTLDFFGKNGLLVKVFTGDNRMYFDTDVREHHHLCSPARHEIADYHDPELTRLIHDYVRQRGIPGFRLEKINLQLIGTIE
ncbi:MAG: transcriptional repressor [Coprobacter sp.]|nr:transcriptional repressor [Coprobacter sp.]